MSAARRAGRAGGAPARSHDPEESRLRHQQAIRSSALRRGMSIAQQLRRPLLASSPSTISTRGATASMLSVDVMEEPESQLDKHNLPVDPRWRTNTDITPESLRQGWDKGQQARGRARGQGGSEADQGLRLSNNCMGGQQYLPAAASVRAVLVVVAIAVLGPWLSVVLCLFLYLMHVRTARPRDEAKDVAEGEREGESRQSLHSSAAPFHGPSGVSQDLAGAVAHAGLPGGDVPNRRRAVPTREGESATSAAPEADAGYVPWTAAGAPPAGAAAPTTREGAGQVDGEVQYQWDDGSAEENREWRYAAAYLNVPIPDANFTCTCQCFRGDGRQGVWRGRLMHHTLAILAAAATYGLSFAYVSAAVQPAQLALRAGLLLSWARVYNSVGTAAAFVLPLLLCHAWALAVGIFFVVWWHRARHDVGNPRAGRPELPSNGLIDKRLQPVFLDTTISGWTNKKDKNVWQPVPNSGATSLSAAVVVLGVVCFLTGAGVSYRATLDGQLANPRRVLMQKPRTCVGSGCVAELDAITPHELCDGWFVPPPCAQLGSLPKAPFLVDCAALADLASQQDADAQAMLVRYCSGVAGGSTSGAGGADTYDPDAVNDGMVACVDMGNALRLYEAHALKWAGNATTGPHRHLNNPCAFVNASEFEAQCDSRAAFLRACGGPGHESYLQCRFDPALTPDPLGTLLSMGLLVVAPGFFGVLRTVDTTRAAARRWKRFNRIYAGYSNPNLLSQWWTWRQYLRRLDEWELDPVVTGFWYSLVLFISTIGAVGIFFNVVVEPRYPSVFMPSFVFMLIACGPGTVYGLWQLLTLSRLRSSTAEDVQDKMHRAARTLLLETQHRAAILEQCPAASTQSDPRADVTSGATADPRGGGAHGDASISTSLPGAGVSGSGSSSGLTAAADAEREARGRLRECARRIDDLRACLQLCNAFEASVRDGDPAKLLGVKVSQGLIVSIGAALASPVATLVVKLAGT